MQVGRLRDGLKKKKTKLKDGRRIMAEPRQGNSSGARVYESGNKYICLSLSLASCEVRYQRSGLRHGITQSAHIITQIRVSVRSRSCPIGIDASPNVEHLDFFFFQTAHEIGFLHCISGTCLSGHAESQGLQAGVFRSTNSNCPRTGAQHRTASQFVL